jgi:hypothetical protein
MQMQNVPLELVIRTVDGQVQRLSVANLLVRLEGRDWQLEIEGSVSPRGASIRVSSDDGLLLLEPVSGNSLDVKVEAPDE